MKKKFQVVKELGGFIYQRRLWWLAPVIVSLLLLGALIVLTESSSVAPFLYALF